MLTRNKKISKQVFGEIIKSGRNFHSPNFSLRLLKTRTGHKLSFVVSKKVSPTAVKRNLLKRRGYSWAKKIFSKIDKSFAGVVFLRPGAAKLDFQTMEKELELLFVSAGLVSSRLKNPLK